MNEGAKIFNPRTGETTVVTLVDNTPGVSTWSNRICDNCGREVHPDYDGNEECVGSHCYMCGSDDSHIEIYLMPYSASMTVRREQ